MPLPSRRTQTLGRQQLDSVRRMAADVLYDPDYEPRTAPMPPFSPVLDIGRYDQLRDMVLMGIDIVIESIDQEKPRGLVEWGYRHVEWAINEWEAHVVGDPDRAT